VVRTSCLALTIYESMQVVRIDHFSKGVNSYGHGPLGEDREDVDEPEGLNYFPLVKMSK